MNRDEEIRLLLVCQLCATFQAYERVIVASQDNLSSHLVFNESLETLRDIQDEFLLREARWSDAAGVMTSVTCVDNHAGELQPQTSDQRSISQARWFCCGDHAVLVLSGNYGCCRRRDGRILNVRNDRR